jgi:hypothetical protein
MTRTIIAIAAASAAAMSLSAPAVACISCEYVPEVVKNHTTSSEPRGYSHSRAYEAAEERRARKSRVSKSDDGGSKAKKHIERAEKPSTTERAEKSEPAKKVETAKAVPETAKPAETENSTFAAAGASDKKQVEAATTTPAKSGPQTEHSTISGASTDKPAGSKTAEANPVPSKDEEKVSNVGCKKFFPTVGLTLSVPCE